jgi:cobaltochelatase CobT
MAESQDRVDLFKRALGAATRAIAVEPEASVDFDAESPSSNGVELHLPLPARELPADEVSHARGAADSFALKLRHHDPSVHAARAPAGGPARAVYDAAEQARVEALGARRMRGVAINLAAALDEQFRGRAGDAESLAQEAMDTPVADVVRLLVRERLTGAAAPDAMRPLIELWRPAIEEKAGADLSALSERIGDQEGYAKCARRLIASLDIWEDQADPSPDEAAADHDNAADETAGDDDDGASEGAEALADEGEGDGESSEQEAAAPESSDDENQPNAGAEEEPGGAKRPWWPDDFPSNAPAEPRYRSYTTEFDEIVDAADLCDAQELAQLRGHLDQQMQHMQGVVARLANRLQRRLLAKQTRAWQFDLDEGILDSGRLARIVANPLHPLSFKVEKETEFRDTVVTLLLDNSGSMRGRPIGVAAMCADVLGHTLERCGVDVEVLGFTTRAWKGGRARERWVAEGKPADPGRLNDTRHIIYKAASAPWRRSRRNLGLMMREGLLKENIDGEALLWAHQRLLAQPHERRILMVISDGAPVDDSTLSVNKGNYLDRHLAQVVRWIEASSPVQLIAIGIGHDVGRYYGRAVTIVDVDQLGGAMVEELATLFDESPRAEPRPGRLHRRGQTPHAAHR